MFEVRPDTSDADLLEISLIPEAKPDRAGSATPIASAVRAGSNTSIPILLVTRHTMSTVQAESVSVSRSSSGPIRNIASVGT